MARVVLIDNDQVFTDVTNMLIKQVRPDLDVQIYNNSRKALTEEADKDADLFLVDIYMPDKNGWEVAETLKEKKNQNLDNLYIISSSIDKHDRVKAIEELGVADFISKPLTTDKLRSIFKQL